MYLKDDHATKRGRFDTGTGSASGSGYPAYPTGAGGGYFPAPAVAAPVPAGPRQYAQSEWLHLGRRIQQWGSSGSSWLLPCGWSQAVCFTASPHASDN